MEGVLAFRNSTGADVTVEVTSVLKRDASVANVRRHFTIRKGQTSWLEVDKKKLSGVYLRFVIHTPDRHQSMWDSWSTGTDKDGYFVTEITTGWMASHAKTPLPREGLNRNPPDGTVWLIDYLQKMVDRVAALEKEDLALVEKAGIAGAVLPKAIDGIDRIRKKSDDWREEFGAWLIKELGQAAVKELARDRIENALLRIKANRALAAEYEKEIKQLKAKLKAPMTPARPGLPPLIIPGPKGPIIID